MELMGQQSVNKNINKLCGLGVCFEYVRTTQADIWGLVSSLAPSQERPAKSARVQTIHTQYLYGHKNNHVPTLTILQSSLGKATWEKFPLGQSVQNNIIKINIAWSESSLFRVGDNDSSRWELVSLHK